MNLSNLKVLFVHNGIPLRCIIQHWMTLSLVRKIMVTSVCLEKARKTYNYEHISVSAEWFHVRLTQTLVYSALLACCATYLSLLILC